MIERTSVALLVSHEMERRLRMATPSVRYHAFRDWLEFAFLELQSPPAAFIVDPMRVPDRFRDGLLGSLGTRRHVPVILYVEMSPTTARVLLQLGKAGIRWVILFNVDDLSVSVWPLLRHAIWDGWSH